MPASNFLLMFALLVAGIVIGVVLMIALRKYPKTEPNISQALLLVALALRATFDDAEVTAVANYVYDRTMVSQYYTKDAWLALVLRVFALLPQQTAVKAQEVITSDAIIDIGAATRAQRT